MLINIGESGMEFVRHFLNRCCKRLSISKLLVFVSIWDEERTIWEMGGRWDTFTIFGHQIWDSLETLQQACQLVELPAVHIRKFTNLEQVWYIRHSKTGQTGLTRDSQNLIGCLPCHSTFITSSTHSSINVVYSTFIPARPANRELPTWIRLAGSSLMNFRSIRRWKTCSTLSKSPLKVKKPSVDQLQGESLV